MARTQYAIQNTRTGWKMMGRWTTRAEAQGVKEAQGIDEGFEVVAEVLIDERKIASRLRARGEAWAIQATIDSCRSGMHDSASVLADGQLRCDHCDTVFADTPAGPDDITREV